MSGFRSKTNSDITKHRQEYIDQLSLQIEIDKINEDANRIFKETGALPAPSQLKDTRTTTEMLKDYEKLKINLINDLKAVADPEFASRIVATLEKSPANVDNKLLVYVAQRAPDIVDNLKKLYKYGIRGDVNDAEQFVSFMTKGFNDKANFTNSTKSFMSRLGANSYQTLSSKLEDFGTKIRKLSTYILAEKNEYEKLMNSIFTRQFRRTAQYTNIMNRIDDVNDSILSITNTLTHIIPNDASFFENIEKILTQLEGSDEYDNYGLPIKEYIYFLNNNIPNIEQLEPLTRQLHQKLLDLQTHKALTDQTLLIPRLESFIDVLNRIYSIFAMYEPTELNRIRKAYDQIKRYKDVYAPQALADNYPVPYRAKELGQQPAPIAPIEQVVPVEYALPPAPRVPLKPVNPLQPADKWPDDLPRDRATMRRALGRARLLKTSIENAIQGQPQEQAIQAHIDQYLQDLQYLMGTNDYDNFASTYSDLENEAHNAGVRINPYHTLIGRGISGGSIQHHLTNSERFERLSDRTQGIKPSPRYVQFGRYMINTKKLNDDIISLRRNKGSTVNTFPAYKVSNNLSSIVKKIIGGAMPTCDELNLLSDEEKRYLQKVSKEADIFDKISIPTPSKDQDEKDTHQFNVMKGEIMAGNDNKELIKKFKILLLKLSKKDVLPKKQVTEIMSELLELGY